MVKESKCGQLFHLEISEACAYKLIIVPRLEVEKGVRTLQEEVSRK